MYELNEFFWEQNTPCSNNNSQKSQKKTSKKIPQKNTSTLKKTPISEPIFLAKDAGPVSGIHQALGEGEIRLISSEILDEGMMGSKHPIIYNQFIYGCFQK